MNNILRNKCGLFKLQRHDFRQKFVNTIQALNYHISHRLQQEDISDEIIKNKHLNNSCDIVVAKKEVVRYIRECLESVGAKKQDAETVADHLMTADYRGHFSHGLNRLEMYIQDIEKKLTSIKSVPSIINDFKAVALVDGQNGMGQVIGKYCMELAIKKAKIFGIGLVSCRGSNHYGIAGYYTLMAAEENLIGISCTNTSPLVAPTNSLKSALGTNPISFAMRACKDNEFVLDMATSAVALGKIELADRKNEAIPMGWAMDTNGKVTTDPKEALKAYVLMPLGGEEINSGYKGYGLAAMVEILCGVLSGSQYGPNIRSWKKGDGQANLGHCFIAIDPLLFASGSDQRLTHLLKQLRELPTCNNKKVLVAGDLERQKMAQVDFIGGISYHQNQIKSSAELAKKLGVKPMKFLKKE